TESLENMMAKTKNKTGYQLEKMGGYDLPVLVRRFKNGSYIIKDNDGDSAGAEGYDHKRRFIGFGPVGELEKFVESGRVNLLNHYEACELENWSYWNGCINAGEVPLQYDSKTQLLSCGDDIYLLAIKEKDGWSTEWLVGCE